MASLRVSKRNEAVSFGWASIIVEISRNDPRHRVRVNEVRKIFPKVSSGSLIWITVDCREEPVIKIVLPYFHMDHLVDLVLVCSLGCCGVVWLGPSLCSLEVGVKALISVLVLVGFLGFLGVFLPTIEGQRLGIKSGGAILVQTAAKTVRKKPKQEDAEQQHDLEILKAVAQAWHDHSINSNSTSRQMSEFDAHPMNFKSRPPRFKLEAMSKPSSSARDNASSWDFGQSLWDSYEIVTVSKKLEAGLVLDDHQFFAPDGAIGCHLGDLVKKMCLTRVLLDFSVVYVACIDCVYCFILRPPRRRISGHFFLHSYKSLKQTTPEGRRMAWI
ncbi:hypothetical protein RJ639_030324 [Escallonia herrerae]|uniref:Uncharacterized protein n=1 Tax=Escallonia herrerae TaxID=1293975 RepID=A0AA89BN15_9ASTE|nr:hypothetical protein RJ639_030324 [Escallonia herrerae]